jgi:hypothetical protein
MLTVRNTITLAAFLRRNRLSKTACFPTAFLFRRRDQCKAVSKSSRPGVCDVAEKCPRNISRRGRQQGLGKVNLKILILTLQAGDEKVITLISLFLDL